jgi:hypothetical protein
VTTLPIWRWRGYPKEWCGGFIQGRKTFIAKGQETLDFYTAQENVFIALKHGVFLMTVIRKLSLMTDLGLLHARLAPNQHPILFTVYAKKTGALRYNKHRVSKNRLNPG